MLYSKEAVKTANTKATEGLSSPVIMLYVALQKKFSPSEKTRLYDEEGFRATRTT